MVKNHVPSRLMGISAYCKQILGSFHCYADLQPTTGNGSVPPSFLLSVGITHYTYIMTNVSFPVPVSCAVKYKFDCTPSPSIMVYLLWKWLCDLVKCYLTSQCQCWTCNWPLLCFFIIFNCGWNSKENKTEKRNVVVTYSTDDTHERHQVVKEFKCSRNGLCLLAFPDTRCGTAQPTVSYTMENVLPVLDYKSGGSVASQSCQGK